jgi:hypothetical protein
METTCTAKQRPRALREMRFAEFRMAFGMAKL